MTSARASEITRKVFYRNLELIEQYLARECKDANIGFGVGRYIGLMQRDLERELGKEVNEDE